MERGVVRKLCNTIVEKNVTLVLIEMETVMKNRKNVPEMKYKLTDRDDSQLMYSNKGVL